MRTASATDLWVSWEDYHHDIETLALAIRASGWPFDAVLCLARGGLRPGDILSRLFKVPLAILSTRSYGGESGNIRGTLDIARHVSHAQGELKGKILLVDDLVDSGATLQAIQTHLPHTFPGITEVRSAVIWYKACSVIGPNYYVHRLEHSPWIHQPFERYEEMDWAEVGRGDSKR